jgi:hypothetical protein
MAIPPRRWVGYALVISGLSLLFDTYTFLRTNWSPLHVPMFAPTELALGYSLAVVGVAVLLAPVVIRLADSCAPPAVCIRGPSAGDRCDDELLWIYRIVRRD